LRSSEAVCPICLRPLDPNDVETAERTHEYDIQQNERILEGFQAESLTQRGFVEQLENLDNAVSGVPTPPRPTGEEAPAVDSSLTAAEAEQHRFAEIVQEIGGRRERLDAVNDELVADKRAAEVSKRLDGFYRRLVLASLLRRTLSRTADELLVRHIDPLARELGSRWKSLWSDRPPIHLTADGRIVSMRAGRSIDYVDFSGGERVVAELVLRLLAISMTTRADFLCLDEPLEHLDPRNRRMIASLLVNAATQSRVRQIISTTYEESVARRLSDQSSGALVYVEGAQ
jgi:DNA repair exonuclease SbcCD ATPase subunit